RHRRQGHRAGWRRGAAPESRHAAARGDRAARHAGRRSAHRCGHGCGQGAGRAGAPERHCSPVTRTRRGVMLEFLRRNRLLATAALFLVLATALIVRPSASRLRDDRIGRFFLEVMAPLQRAGSLASRGVVTAWKSTVGLWGARQEADALRTRVAELERDTAA